MADSNPSVEDFTLTNEIEMFNTLVRRAISYLGKRKYPPEIIALLLQKHVDGRAPSTPLSRRLVFEADLRNGESRRPELIQRVIEAGVMDGEIADGEGRKPKEVLHERFRKKISDAKPDPDLAAIFPFTIAGEDRASALYLRMGMLGLLDVDDQPPVPASSVAVSFSIPDELAFVRATASHPAGEVAGIWIGDRFFRRDPSAVMPDGSEVTTDGSELTADVSGVNADVD